jgi:RNA polymerase sigma-70 factor, ECF subfamily
MTLEAIAVARHRSESELAAALIAGDPEAPRLIWQTFLPLVRGMSRRALGPGPEVDDAVQEVFCCLFRGAHRLRAPEAFRGFLITITKRALGHEVRRRRARSRLVTPSELHVAEAVGQWNDPATPHAYRHFELLLGRLKERERRAYVLRFVERMDIPEVAESLGVSIPTARRAFTRAQARMTLWAGRHPFLSDYLVAKAPVTASSDEPFETDSAA